MKTLLKDLSNTNKKIMSKSVSSKFLSFILTNSDDKHFLKILDKNFIEYQNKVLNDFKLSLSLFYPRKDKPLECYVCVKCNFPISPTKCKLISLTVGRFDKYQSMDDPNLKRDAENKMFNYLTEMLNKKGFYK